MTVKMHLTQAERDLIVELCLAAKLHHGGDHHGALEIYMLLERDDWERVNSIIFKLDTPDPDLWPPPIPD